MHTPLLNCIHGRRCWATTLETMTEGVLGDASTELKFMVVVLSHILENEKDLLLVPARLAGTLVFGLPPFQLLCTMTKDIYPKFLLQALKNTF